MADPVLLLATAASAEEASRIARALVAEGLAACVQHHPIESLYRWQGQVEHTAEHRLHIKTTAALADMVEARIKAMHSYDVPEIVTLAIAGGSAEYLAWVSESVAPELRSP